MKNTITQVPNSYLINDSLLAVAILNDDDKRIGFCIYPIVQIKDDNTHRLYYIALIPDCHYIMSVDSNIKTKNEDLLKRKWTEHALDITTTCTGRKKYITYYVNGNAAYHIFKDIDNNSYTFICTCSLCRSFIEIYDNIIFNICDFISAKATAKIRNTSRLDKVECNPDLPIIVLGYDELELYN